MARSRYLISFGVLVITVYFLDFLYSEQTRKETANKRYIIDAEIDKIIQEFQFGIADLLFNDKPDENGLYDFTRIYHLDENEIHIMIASPLFWETGLNLKHVKGFDYLINKNDFFNELLDKKRKELNNILIKYSNLTLYEDFKRIHALDELLQSFYFKQGSHFQQMNQLMIANQLETLIGYINDGLHVFGKWK